MDLKIGPQAKTVYAGDVRFRQPQEVPQHHVARVDSDGLERAEGNAVNSVERGIVAHVGYRHRTALILGGQSPRYGTGGRVEAYRRAGWTVSVGAIGYEGRGGRAIVVLTVLGSQFDTKIRVRFEQQGP